MKAVCKAPRDLTDDLAKVNIYLTDLRQVLLTVNELMSQYLKTAIPSPEPGSASEVRPLHVCNKFE